MIPPSTINAQLAVSTFESLLLQQQHRVLRLIGESKLGKSHLMRDVFPELCQVYKACCVYLDLQGNESQTPLGVLSVARGILFRTHQIRCSEYDRATRETPPGSISIEKMAQLGSVTNINAPVYGDEVIWSRIPQLTSGLIDDLAQVPSTQIVFLLDSIDQARDRTREWLLTSFLVEVAQLPHVRVVLAGQTMPSVAGGYAAVTETLKLEPVDEQEFILYCRRVRITLQVEEIRFLAKAVRYRPGLFVECVNEFK